MDGWDPGVSFDALMARVSSNVRASTSRGTGDAGEVDASWDLSSLSRLFHQLFEEGVDEPLGGARGAGRWGSSPAASSAAVWMLAVVLRYCDDAGAPVTPDVFGSAVAGWQEVFSRAPRGTFSPGAFPFEEQLGDEAVVSWACWVAWCARHGSGRGPAGGWSNSAERTRWPADSSTSPLGASRGRSMLQAMVCCHVPCSEDHGFGAFDRLMMFLRASLWLLDAPSSSFSRWYSGQCIQRCMSLADRVHLTRDEQLMALGALADAREGTRPARQTNEGFVLTATSALTRAGGRILSPDAAIEMLRVLSSSTRRFDSTYRSLIESLMAVYTDMPDHADMVLDRWELFDPRIALAVLLPACHSLSALTITSKLAPICLNMLKACQGKAMQDDGGGRSGLLPLLQDVRIWAWCRRRCVASIILLFSRSLVLSLFCSLVHVPVSLSAPRLTAPFVAPCQVYLHGILISPRLATEDTRGIGLSLVAACPASSPDFSLSACVEVLVLANDGALAEDVLDGVSERARGAGAEGDGAFRALADALDVVRLDALPGVCARLASRACGRPDAQERLASLKRTIEASLDVTRKEFLVAWFCDISE